MIKIHWDSRLYELSVRFRGLIGVDHSIQSLHDRWRWEWITQGLPLVVVHRLNQDRRRTKWEYLVEQARMYRAGLDPRDSDSDYTVCPHCQVRTYEKYHYCWRCNLPVNGRSAPAVMYKYGSRLFTRSEVLQSEKANTGQGAVDMLQPTRHYDKSNKSWYTNPAYVKHYGDPFVGDNKSH